MDQGPVKPSSNSPSSNGPSSNGPSSNGPSYVNRRGKRVTLLISKHAFFRFRERWANLFPNQVLSISDTERVMVEWFQQASRLEEPSGKLQDRLKRHGKDTLYFKTRYFTFVVQDATIVTVEISDKNRRHLNRQKPASKPVPTLLVGAAPAGAERHGKDELDEKRKSAKDAARQPDPSFAEVRGSPKEKADAQPDPARVSGTAIDSPTAMKRASQESSGPTRFRMSVSAYSPEEDYRFINLGSYDAIACAGDAKRLKDMPGFVDEMLQRLESKRPGWKLVLVMAKLGPRGEQVTVMRFTGASPS